MSKRRPAKVQQVCVCGHPAPKGSLICGDCVKATSRRLGDQQALSDELHVTLTRQAKLDPAPEAGRSAVRPLPYNTAASELLAEQRKLLTRWCVTCVRDLHTPEPAAYTVRGLSMHIEANLAGLRKHDKAHDLVADLTGWCQRATDCIDRQDRTYPVGPCPVETGEGWCPGKVMGFIPLSDPDGSRPARIACDRCGTEWSGSQWASLARLIQRRKAA